MMEYVVDKPLFSFAFHHRPHQLTTTVVAVCDIQISSSPKLQNSQNNDNMAQNLARLPRLLSRRAFSTCTRYSTSFKTGPAPPRLPKEEQEVFEKLQKQSTGAFSTPRNDAPNSQQSDIGMRINQSPDSSSPSTPPTPAASQPSRPQINQSPDSEPEIRFENGNKIKSGEEFHPNMRRGAPPEFEGDTNPKTGEVGGPKNEPLRWGGKGDWSYNGRVTDF